jgi:hypothetical protein
MNGFGDLLGRNKAMPEEPGTHRSNTFEQKKEAWLDKQERACAAARSRLGYNAREEVKGKAVLDELLLGLEKRFRPTGSAIFQQLDRRYHDLTLAECKGVSDFAEQLQEARNELLELDETCLIGEPHFVNKFLSGLGPSFDIFLTSFYQTHSLIPERDDKKEIATKAVTFETAVIAAEKEEQSQKVREEKVAYLAKGGGSGDAKEVPWCSHCDKAFHTRDSCFTLHPELRRAREDKDDRKKKRTFQKRNLDKKKDKAKESTNARKEDAEESDDSSNPNAALAWQLPENAGALGFVAAQEGAATTISPLRDIYVVDTGCSQHSSCRKEDFISLRPYSGRPLSGIGGSKLIPQGVGTIKLECNSHGKRVFMLLANTLYCPDIGVNLLSGSQLLDIGAMVSFQQGKASITHGTKNFTATQRAGLFLLDL